ncbi:unnamed protein product [Cyprideis torosa]|uniref:Uncharacterized protein n=1 Tax=Cyprideis torosa TaxID=163714 RepID=A0A7R8WCX8_9CRUS|nr:unnamed protein product [Cyprideis torosa]CAG0888394.1 unnamed protein product [Cyprideis torosa]
MVQLLEVYQVDEQVYQVDEKVKDEVALGTNDDSSLRDGSGQSNFGKVLSLSPKTLFILAVEYGIAAFSRHKKSFGTIQSSRRRVRWNLA